MNRLLVILIVAVLAALPLASTNATPILAHPGAGHLSRSWRAVAASGFGGPPRAIATTRPMSGGFPAAGGKRGPGTAALRATGGAPGGTAATRPITVGCPAVGSAKTLAAEVKIGSASGAGGATIRRRA
jgi:hypothetical protein